MGLYGVDVSSFQGNYAWSSEAFGFAKATEGTFYQDAYFAHNWNTMWSKKILRGAYHFAHPGTDAVAQAKYFVNFVKSHGLTANDVLALDLEVTDGKTASQVNTWAVNFCNEVKSLCAKNVWVYVNGSYASGAYTSGLRSHPLWIANPNSNAGSTTAGAWANWTCHQYSWSPVDKDYFSGSEATWKLLCNTGKAATAKPAAAKAPPLPSGFKFTATSDSVTATWVRPTGITKYDCQLTNSAGAWVAGKVVTAKTVTFTGLQPGTEYKFRISSMKDGAPSSAWSGLAPVTTTAQTFPAPSGLRAQNVTVDLWWEPLKVTAAEGTLTGYTVQCLNSKGKQVSQGSVPSNNAQITVPRGDTYTFNVWGNGAKVAPPHSTLKVTV